MIVKLKPDTNSPMRQNIELLYHIKYGKEYDAEIVVRKYSDNWYKIKCDDGHTREFSSINFVSIEDMRDEKLNDLGI